VFADPDIPKGRMIWMFDDTDMARAKQIVGARQAIGGNVPGSLLTMARPSGSTPTSRTCSQDGGNGGFFLGTGIVLDEADPACFKAFCDAGRTYGAAVVTQSPNGGVASSPARRSSARLADDRRAARTVELDVVCTVPRRA